MALSAANIEAKITAISTTLDALYTKTAKDMSLESRKIVLQDIDKLEASLAYWEGRQNVASGAKPRVASINLNTPGDLR